MKRRQLHVEPLEPRFRGEFVVLRVRISGHPRATKRNGTLLFEVPAELHEWLVIQGRPDDLHDPWLRAAIFSAMEAGTDLAIHGNVSTSLLANLETYQEIIHCCWPQQYTPVAIQADAEVSGPAGRSCPSGREAILAFSGGLDSVCSLYCHKKGLRGRNQRDVSACLFVHGFDIHWKDRAFAAALARAGRITQSLDVRLVPLRTNLRRRLPSWEQVHAGAVSAALSLFGARYATGLVAASYAYDNPFAFRSNIGSTPLSDPLLSADSFRIVHDGADRSRVEKTEILRHWEIARRNLRVCWAGDDLSANCGRCRKCLLQMLCMRAVGLDDLSAFQAPLEPDNILALTETTPAGMEEWQKCYAVAEGNGLAASSEFLAVKQLLARWQGAPPPHHGVNGHHRRPGFRGLFERILGRS